MRIAVLSDAHANRPALQAVLDDALGLGVERFWFLGDAVGYGPHALAAVRWLQRQVRADDWVLGNHDAMLAGLLDKGNLDGVRKSARQMIELNRQALAGEAEAQAFWQAEFTAARLTARAQPLDGWLHVLTHAGQVANPTRYIYPWDIDIYLKEECLVMERQSAESQMPGVLWFGHTHVPTLIYVQLAGDGQHRIDPARPLPDELYPLSGPLMLVNPGAVGQPRNLDPRAAYVILDSKAGTIRFRRLAYNLRETISDLISLWPVDDFPDELIDQLRTAEPHRDTPPEWTAHYRAAREMGR